MRTTILFTLLILTAMGCGKTSETTSENTPGAEAAAEPISEDVRHPLLENYVQLKNALVQSEPEKAAAAAKSMAEKATGEISESAAAIAESTDLAVQRDHFFTLSNAMYTYVKNQESLGQKVYWQYCPMARDNEGANWLSLESEIRNPYFGDAMLTCGAVQEEL